MVANHVIEDAGSERGRRPQRLAVRAHVEREPRAGQPRQPLSAAGAGNDAEQDFRLSDRALGRRDAVVARHRHLETASERVPLDRRDERLRRVLDALQEGMDGRRARQRVFARLQEVEHLDVRPRDERRAGAGEDDGFRAWVRARARDSFADGFPDGGTQGVDRRVLDGQDSHAVRDVVVNEVRHSKF